MPFKKRDPDARDARARRIVPFCQLTDGPAYSTVARATQVCPPFVTIGELAAEIAAEVAFRAQVRALCRKGDRVVAELLTELGAERTIMTVIEEKLDRFLGISDAELEVVGARELPPAPLHEVQR